MEIKEKFKEKKTMRRTNSIENINTYKIVGYEIVEIKIITFVTIQHVACLIR
ncbi:hypothetical protein [Alkaliphilus metalliredigens]|uniref:hypothetical protein n=1 Tax=Alkaliphilus metalliredigens TaxID=208226 RepID=UPI0002F7E5AA|nr:hypothetical protein [Alkaliphilus metalliredigens]